MKNYVQVMIRGALATMSAAIVVGASVRPAEAIIGGTRAKIENYPYMGGLLISKSSLCGAVLIHERAALTAAHCVVGVAPTGATVVFGSADLSAGGVTAEVKRIWVHEGHSSTTQDHDIATIVLKNSLKPHFGAKIGVANIGVTKPRGVSTVTMAGWGVVDAAVTTTKWLMHVQASIIDRPACGKFYHLAPSGAQYCIGTGDKNACAGDYGGPVIATDGSLVGLSSYGSGCGMNTPTVATDVTTPEHRAWIANIVGGL